MKKFIVLFVICNLFISCATTYNTLGNITLMTSNGDVVNTWNNAIIGGSAVSQTRTSIGGQSVRTSKIVDVKTYSMGNVSFIDNKGVSHFVSSGSGMIIIDNIHRKYDDEVNTNNNTQTEKNSVSKKEKYEKEKQYCINKYKELNDKLMKKGSLRDDEYDKLKKELKKVKYALYEYGVNINKI